MRAYYEDNKEKYQQYYQENKDRIKKYQTERHKKRPWFKLSMRATQGLIRCIRCGTKGPTWEKRLGFSVEEFKKHMESKFKDDMSWDNYGKWHVDHIVPVSSFCFDSYGHPDFKKCWSLSNVQPLWARENMKKGSKIIYDNASKNK